MGKALTRLNIKYNLKWFFEIDKYAIQSYCAIHNVSEDLNKGDITAVNPKELDDIDMLVYSPPCQSYSVAGKRLGIDDPRGVLFYDALKIIREKKPKYALMENVKGLTTGKNKEVFEDMLAELDLAGYNNYWKVLNSKDFGIPQNRERVFIVSIRKDIEQQFDFPKEFENNNKKIKHVLEDEVDDTYFMSKERCDALLKDIKKDIRESKSGIIQITNPKFSQQRVYSPEGIAPTIPAGNRGGGKEPCKILCIDDILEPDAMLPILHNIYGGFGEKKPRIFTEYPPTIRTSSGGGHIPNVCTTDEDKMEKEVAGYQIRKLTPKECWRLQDFDDEDIEKCIDIGISNTQLYKQAGNSITVKVVEEIFKVLLKDYMK